MSLVYLNVIGVYFGIFLSGHLAELLFFYYYFFNLSLWGFFWSKDLFPSVNTGIHFLFKTKPFEFGTLQHAFLWSPKVDATLSLGCHSAFPSLAAQVQDLFAGQNSLHWAHYWPGATVLQPDDPAETSRQTRLPHSSSRKGEWGSSAHRARHLPGASLSRRGPWDSRWGLTGTQQWDTSFLWMKFHLLILPSITPQNSCRRLFPQAWVSHFAFVKLILVDLYAFSPDDCTLLILWNNVP